MYDLNGLKDYWNHFDQSVFERLDQNFTPGFGFKSFSIKTQSNCLFYYQAIKKMENSLLRMYLINACTNSKQEKVQEFFEKLGSDLQHQLEWKDWFGKFQIQFFYFTCDHQFFLIALPFVKNPEENPTFMVYFTRQWQDTMLISLHNLLAVSFQVRYIIFS